MFPAVVVDSPPSWVAGDIERPALGPQSIVTQWDITQSESNGRVLGVGCVATTMPGWAEELRPWAEARALSYAMPTAQHIVGYAVEPRIEGQWLALRPVGRADSPAVGFLRTFVGWHGRQIMTCFSICAESRGANASTNPNVEDCLRYVQDSRLVGSTVPPEPGFVVSTFVWPIRHPSKAVGWASFLVVFAGAAAVVTRRRPRSRL